MNISRTAWAKANRPGTNRLAADSTADWLLLLNPDAQLVTWPWPDAIDRRPDEVVGAAQVSPEGRPLRAWAHRFDVREEIADHSPERMTFKLPRELVA